jgi:hypothetical protein
MLLIIEQTSLAAVPRFTKATDFYRVNISHYVWLPNGLLHARHPLCHCMFSGASAPPQTSGTRRPIR